MMKEIIFLNKNIYSLTIKKKKYNLIYFYNKNIFFYLFCNYEIRTNNNLNYIELKKKNNLNREITNIFHNIFEYSIKKFIFNGKGFKLKKISNKNIFNFNNSHLKMIFEKKIKIIKNNKNSFIFLQKYKNKNIKIINFLINLFKMNIFTKKGIKLSSKIIKIKKTKKK